MSVADNIKDSAIAKSIAETKQDILAKMVELRASYLHLLEPIETQLNDLNLRRAKINQKLDQLEAAFDTIRVLGDIE